VEDGRKSADFVLNFPLSHFAASLASQRRGGKSKELPVSAHSLEVKIRPHEILTLRVAAMFANQPPGGTVVVSLHV